MYSFKISSIPNVVTKKTRCWRQLPNLTAVTKPRICKTLSIAKNVRVLYLRVSKTSQDISSLVCIFYSGHSTYFTIL